MKRDTLTSKQSLMILIAVSLSALIIFNIINLAYNGCMDLGWYKLWAVDIHNNGNIFGIYQPSRANSISLDYPPLYLFLLGSIGALYDLFHATLANGAITMFDNFAMNFYTVLSCVVIGWIVYFTLRKHGELIALVSGVAFILNPACIVNGVVWGQTDVILICLLIVAFHCLEEDRRILACVLFAVAVLTKYQAVLFGPVFLLQLIRQTKLTRASIKHTATAMIYSACVFMGVFLPFMAGSGKYNLIFELYTGGQKKYPYFSLEAMNIFGASGLDWSASGRAQDSAHWLGGITYAQLSNIIIVVSILVLIAFTIFVKRNLAFINCFILMQTIFMFTTRMHERYEFIVIPFIFYAYIKTKFKPFLASFILVTLITAFNQLVVLFRNNPGGDFFSKHYNSMFILSSKINVAIYFITLAACLYYYFYPSASVAVQRINDKLFHKPDTFTITEANNV